MNQQTEKCIAVFSLPNSQLQREGADEAAAKILNLFDKNEFANGNPLQRIEDLKQHIFMPSPDYIIAVLKSVDMARYIQPLLQQQAVNPDSLEIYKLLKGKLQIEEFKAAVSLKTSNRPDRRYQPLFEAAMIKAMAYVLQQKWRYYMVAGELTNADRIIFNSAVAPHGVALQQNYQLVDGTYPYTRKADLVPLI